MKYNYIALMLLASVLCGCRTGKSNDGESSTGFILEGNKVKIEAGSPLESKLKLTQLQKEDINQGFTVTASVSPRPDGYAADMVDHFAWINRDPVLGGSSDTECSQCGTNAECSFHVRTFCLTVLSGSVPATCLLSRAV